MIEALLDEATTQLLPLSAYLPCPSEECHESPAYFYEGRCSQTGRWLRLPRTCQAEEVARTLMKELAQEEIFQREGKMYGVLIVELPSGEKKVLRAFSGLLQGQPTREGWVPPLPGKERFALEEARVLEELDRHKAELQELHQLPIRKELRMLQEEYKAAREKMAAQHKQNKAHRREKRQQIEATLTGKEREEALRKLGEESQKETYERRDLKRMWDRRCRHLEEQVRAADQRMLALRQARKTLSRTLQAAMHTAYEVMNFSGDTASLNELFAEGRLPSGTGDCCAPKLLHYAAFHKWKPVSLAEFWWGPPPANGRKREGLFYGACEERCQPIMGFLLSGLPVTSPEPVIPKDAELSVLYEDAYLLVIDKPSGLASVPGRTFAHYDSVASRARHLFPELPTHVSVHRLDMATSGVLLLAKSREAFHAMSELFRKRQMSKQYEAILEGSLSQNEGEIRLPLAPDWKHRPKQKVDVTGKPSCTRYRVIALEGGRTRVLFQPITGRTHQLRVHAASPKGLNAPIVGDALYHPHPEGRLLLHASSLAFVHPFTGKELILSSPVPF